VQKKSPPKKDLDGVLVLYKPSGPTSTDCLNQIKRLLGRVKIGHAGTLDPLAQGVLVVLLGAGTKIAPYVTSGEKTYWGRLLLGVSTDTYDIQGTVTATSGLEGLDPERVKAEVDSWTGTFDQEVPGYSAAKHQGKPLYELARKGLETPVKVKPVTVHEAHWLEVDLPRVSFRVRCSAGTYIRSLVHSLGKRLGCGATLEALVREASHPFTAEQALPLEDILARPGLVEERLVPLRDALPHWTRIRLDEEGEKLVRNGAWLPVARTGVPARSGDLALLLAADGEALALAEATLRDRDLKWSILRGLW
jgi:tRNA pseudouridine55 synthase